MVELATFFNGPYDRMENIKIDTQQKELALLISRPTIEIMGTNQANWDKSKSLGEMLAEASHGQMRQFQNGEQCNYAVYRQRETNRTEYEFVEYRKA